MLSRRRFAVGAVGLFLLGRRDWWRAAWELTPITVYKSRSCGCCTKWVDHVRAEGFDPKVHDEEAMDQVKDELGIPPAVRSCHTAVVGGYLIEGHVPASDIRRLLAGRPKVAGLAVPGMPGGTPGMAEPGAKAGDYQVISFQSNGSTEVYATH
jgi:hypothetical protein